MKKLILLSALSVLLSMMLGACSGKTMQNDRYNRAPATTERAVTTTDKRDETKMDMPGDILPSTNVPDSTYEGAAERAAEGIRDGIDRAADEIGDGIDSVRDRVDSRNSDG